MNASPFILEKLPESEQEDFKTFHYEDEVAVVVIPFKRKGVARPGHAHHYDHTSFVASGAVRVYAGAQMLGVFKAPVGFTIKAGVFHTYIAEEDDTTVLCIHNTHGWAPEQLEAGLVAERNPDA